MQDIHYGLILIAAFVATASPGPATLAIAGSAMSSGRRHGVATAFGILTGSFIWSFSGAFGMAAVMYANAWLFDILRYFGAAYLLFLAFKSFKSVLHPKSITLEQIPSKSLKADYLRGLAIHLTNPKVILFFGALYSMGVPSTVDMDGLLSIIFLIGMQSMCLFLGYALLFSQAKIRTLYFRMSRVFDSLFTLFFGIAGIKILMSKLSA
ncbi:LysE family translocator [Marinomonas posidonica]|uniref:Lysine exporter protein (LYSE/YGGA) n=1 Tax=Marinomonas posidonica (strain CECT 7376 / NCIMB 14433 / IVIA-Po-181) TaxID=491952 RepID=F6D0R1_MARPP|nr:LysE family translocator [Marinomonas posidonica]AEF55943.1 Lysine exporter protein (LYSE/YGGA) [Marinomonas posidonica IVIA-Po-181]